MALVCCIEFARLRITIMYGVACWSFQEGRAWSRVGSFSYAKVAGEKNQEMAERSAKIVYPALLVLLR